MSNDLVLKLIAKNKLSPELKKVQSDLKTVFNSMFDLRKQRELLSASKKGILTGSIKSDIEGITLLQRKLKSLQKQYQSSTTGANRAKIGAKIQIVKSDIVSKVNLEMQRLKNSEREANIEAKKLSYSLQDVANKSAKVGRVGTKSMNDVRNATKESTKSLVNHIRKVESLIVGYYLFRKAIAQTFGKGLEYYKNMEEQTTKFKAILYSLSKDVDSQNNKLTLKSKMKLAKEEADNLVQGLKKINLETAHGIPQLSKFMGLILPQSKAGGANNKQITELTKLISLLASTNALKDSELVAGLDNIVSGTSKIGELTNALKAYGIDMKEVKKIYDEGGNSVQYMIDKLKALNDVAPDIKAQWGNTWAYFSQVLSEALGEGQAPLFDYIKTQVILTADYIKSNMADIQEVWKNVSYNIIIFFEEMRIFIVENNIGEILSNSFTVAGEIISGALKYVHDGVIFVFNRVSELAGFINQHFPIISQLLSDISGWIRDNGAEYAKLFVSAGFLFIGGALIVGIGSLIVGFGSLLLRVTGIKGAFGLLRKSLAFLLTGQVTNGLLSAGSGMATLGTETATTTGKVNTLVSKLKGAIALLGRIAGAGAIVGTAIAGAVNATVTNGADRQFRGGAKNLKDIDAKIAQAVEEYNSIKNDGGGFYNFGGYSGKWTEDSIKKRLNSLGKQREAIVKASRSIELAKATISEVTPKIIEAEKNANKLVYGQDFKGDAKAKEKARKKAEKEEARARKKAERANQKALKDAEKEAEKKLKLQRAFTDKMKKATLNEYEYKKFLIKREEKDNIKAGISRVRAEELANAKIKKLRNSLSSETKEIKWNDATRSIVNDGISKDNYFKKGRELEAKEKRDKAKLEKQAFNEMVDRWGDAVGQMGDIIESDLLSGIGQVLRAMGDNYNPTGIGKGMDKVFKADTYSSEVGSLGKTIGGLFGKQGEIIGGLAGNLIGGFFGKKKKTGSGYNLTKDSDSLYSLLGDTKSYDDYQKKSWFSKKKWTKTKSLDGKASQALVNSYMDSIDTLVKGSVYNLKFTAGKFKTTGGIITDALFEGLTGQIVDFGKTSNFTGVESAWRSDAESVGAKVEETLVVMANLLETHVNTIYDVRKYQAYKQGDINGLRFDDRNVKSRKRQYSKQFGFLDNVTLDNATNYADKNGSILSNPQKLKAFDAYVKLLVEEDKIKTKISSELDKMKQKLLEEKKAETEKIEAEIKASKELQVSRDKAIKALYQSQNWLTEADKLLLAKEAYKQSNTFDGEKDSLNNLLGVNASNSFGSDAYNRSKSMLNDFAIKYGTKETVQEVKDLELYKRIDKLQESNKTLQSSIARLETATLMGRDGFGRQQVVVTK